MKSQKNGDTKILMKAKKWRKVVKIKGIILSEDIKFWRGESSSERGETKIYGKRWGRVGYKNGFRRVDSNWIK